MANADGEGIIVVSFGRRSKAPIVVASFDTPFEGRDYLERVPAAPNRIGYVCPESSSAEIAIVNGKPRIWWTGD